MQSTRAKKNHLSRLEPEGCSRKGDRELRLPRTAAEDQRNQKQDQEHDEQHFGYPRGGTCDSGKAEKGGDERYD